MDTPIDRQRLIVKGMSGIYEKFAPYSYSFMRFVTGAILVPHGVVKVMSGDIARYTTNIGGKGLPAAELLSYLVFFTESFGALFLAIGLFTRVAAAMVGIQMLVIAFVWQWRFGYFWTERGYEFALMWGLLCVAIFFRGGGRYSVDHYIGKEF
jgi:putative oxidoreductase